MICSAIRNRISLAINFISLSTKTLSGRMPCSSKKKKPMPTIMLINIRIIFLTKYFVTLSLQLTIFCTALQLRWKREVFHRLFIFCISSRFKFISIIILLLFIRWFHFLAHIITNISPIYNRIMYNNYKKLQIQDK